MNKMIRIHETPERYDLAGRVIEFAMKVHLNLAQVFWNQSTKMPWYWSCQAGMKTEAEKAISVFYQGELVGNRGELG
ncbi:MAG: hypothetical protein QOH24_670 [Verrucomicrobiota bacterium]|jgi:hypothetical protein